jgi:hypothetical protein
MGDTDIDAIMRLMSGSGMDSFIEQYVQEYVDNMPKELTEEEKQEQRREKFGKMSCPFDGYEDTKEDEVDTLMDLDTLGGMDEEEGDYDGYYDDYRDRNVRRALRTARLARDTSDDEFEW